MKLQWRSLSALQESRFAAFKQRKDLIGNLNQQQHVKSFKLKNLSVKTPVEKDVNRTDRTISYYAGENNKNVSTLRDVLMTYMMFDFDLGYVQVNVIFHLRLKII